MKCHPFCAALFIASSVIAGQDVPSTIPDRELLAAISNGQRFERPADFIDSLSQHKVRMSSILASDQISRYITVISETTAVTAAAVDAKRRLKPFSIDDARSIANGLTHLSVELRALGSAIVSDMARKYGNDQAHLVLQFGETIVQPLDARLLSAQTSSYYFGWTGTAMAFGNLGIVFGAPIGAVDGKMTMSFSFALSNAQLKQKATAILIDANGNRREAVLDFSKNPVTQCGGHLYLRRHSLPHDAST